MTETPEKMPVIEGDIEDIEKQIDTRISELEKIDEEKARILDNSKDELINEIGGGQYIDDEGITDDELREVFNSPTLHTELGKSNIQTFEEFKQLIGLEAYYPDGTLRARRYPAGNPEKKELEIYYPSGELKEVRYNNNYTGVDKVHGYYENGKDKYIVYTNPLKCSNPPPEKVKAYHFYEDYNAGRNGIIKEEFPPNPQNIKARYYHENGKIGQIDYYENFEHKSHEEFNEAGILETTYYAEEQPDFIEQKNYYKNGKPEIIFYRKNKEHKYLSMSFSKDGLLNEIDHKEFTEYFDQNGKKARLDKKTNTMVFYDKKGKESDPVGTIEYARTLDPKMTPEEYIEFLAYHLNTPEKIALFFQAFMEYQKDVHDKRWDMGRKSITALLGDREYIKKAMEEVSDEHWQYATETVERIEKIDQREKMLGDCDDYAFLAAAILKKQGTKAYVTGTPGHATTLWLEQDTSGNIHAHTLGTYGYDHDGQIYGELPREASPVFSTRKQAINSTMEKFDEKGLGIESPVYYRIEDMIEILTLGKNSERLVAEVPLDELEINKPKQIAMK